MKRIPYNVTGVKRKALVKAVSGAIGVKAVYKFVPTCAYEIGPFTVTKDGALEYDEQAAGEQAASVLGALAAAGFETGAEIPQEAAAASGAVPVTLTVTLPMEGHTGNTLRNLVNLVFTRGMLINRALGTAFHADEGFVEALRAADIDSADDLLKAAATFEEEHGKAVEGISFTPEAITFSSLPETEETEAIRAFTDLCAMMNRQALTQKRIQAKAVDGENEKYAMRIWLTRLGMNGPEFRETRKVLMRDLAGHSAFRTEAEKERWTKRQAEKRAAAKQP